jgi:hypothetical protein
MIPCLCLLVLLEVLYMQCIFVLEFVIYYCFPSPCSSVHTVKPMCYLVPSFLDTTVPWKGLWVNGVHHVTLNPTETSWIHHRIVQLFCATDTDRWYCNRFVLSIVGHTRKEITNTQSQAWYIYQYNCFQNGIHKPAVCRMGCCKRVNRYTGLALYISKASTCLGWHTSRDSIIVHGFFTKIHWQYFTSLTTNFVFCLSEMWGVQKGLVQNADNCV